MTKPTGSWAVLACGTLLWAASQSAQANISVTVGGVITAPPPCVINGGSTSDTSFGNNLQATQIDGVNYLTTVNYTIVCNSPPSDAMTLELQGIGASFDSDVLMTGDTNLGVKLLMSGSDWPLNSVVNFTYPTTPVMQAVPVKRPGSTLVGGAFTASATLVVNYQ